MSRCFAYPPPGYSVSHGVGPALIESIKLQRGSELAKAETKKDRKKDKKGRRKEKKEKSKGSLLPEKTIHKRSSSGPKIRSLQKLIQSEIEQLERSSLTEELVQPVGEEKPSTSSDSTQNSSKRKREDSSPVAVRPEENSMRSNGNVIRIRLPLQKRNALVSKQEPCSTTSQRTELASHVQTTSQRTELLSLEQKAISTSQQPCSTSGRSELATTINNQECQLNIPSIQQGHNNLICLRPPRHEVDKVSSASLLKLVNREDTVTVVGKLPENKLPNVALPPRPDRKVTSTLGVPKVITCEDDIGVRDPKSLDKKMVKADLRYRDLFLNWVTPPQTEFESDDQDWLFSKKKNPDNESEKKLKPNVSRCSDSSLWPRAQFIPEADIYGLPFTVPF